MSFFSSAKIVESIGKSSKDVQEEQSTKEVIKKTTSFFGSKVLDVVPTTRNGGFFSSSIVTTSIRQDDDVLTRTPVQSPRRKTRSISFKENDSNQEMHGSAAAAITSASHVSETTECDSVVRARNKGKKKSIGTKRKFSQDLQAADIQNEPVQDVLNNTRALDVYDDYIATKDDAIRKSVSSITAVTTSDETDNDVDDTSLKPGLQNIFRSNFFLTEVLRDVDEAKEAHIAQLPNAIMPNPYAFSYIYQAITHTPSDCVAPILPASAQAQLRAHLFVSSRAHEETMMRTPKEGEQACKYGRDCQGNRLECKMISDDCTLRAYYHETEWEEYKKSGSLPSNQRPCILCIRAEVTGKIIFLKNLRRPHRQFAKDGTTPMALTDICNYVNIPNEYRIEDCEIPTSDMYCGIIVPIVRSDVFGFVREKDPNENVIWIRQLLKYPSKDAKQMNFLYPEAANTASEQSSF